MKHIYTAIILLLSLTSLLPAQEFKKTNKPIITEYKFLPETMHERGKSIRQWKATRTDLLFDRKEYYSDEIHGQAIAMFFGKLPRDSGGLNMTLALNLLDKTGKAVEEHTFTPVDTTKLVLLMRTIDLKPGKYTLKAILKSNTGETVAEAENSFLRTDKKDPAPEFPAKGININIHSQDHIPDTSWPFTTGVPIPKATILTTDNLQLYENGKPVPAQFIVRSTWSPKGYIKWVGLDFIAQYKNGKAAEYILKLEKNAVEKKDSDLKYTETDTEIAIQNSIYKCLFKKQEFSGIASAWLDKNGDKDFSENEKIITEGRGGFISDNKGRHYATDSGVSEVSITEAGPVSILLTAKGSYGNTEKELGRYIIRMRFYKDLPYINVTHRMINTIHDQYTDQKLTDVGFEIFPEGEVKDFRLGFDQKELKGSPLAKGKQLFLHQMKSNQLRIVKDEKDLAAGKRADGWLNFTTDRGSISYHLKDIWQKYPKEFEIENKEGKHNMSIHFWPKHGKKVFTEEEELARNQIYKVRYAHHGKELNFLIPDNYHKRLEGYNEKEKWAGGYELGITDKKRNKTKIQSASGQGAVVGNKFTIWFDKSSPSLENLNRRSGIIQQAPHALSSPAWNCSTRVIGPLAPRNPERHKTAEKLLDTAYDFYMKTIIDNFDEYGMWTYGGVHNNWEADKDVPTLKRVWQMCHYQNIFQAWMLYFRSGQKVHYKWADIHSAQHYDVGVNNYSKYPKGKHSYSHIGENGGQIYHCKGFMPWAGNAATGRGHWIDVTCYFMSYFLTGDRTGMDLAEKWISSQNKMGKSNKPEVHDTYRDNYKMIKVNKFIRSNKKMDKKDYPQWVKDELAKPRGFTSREFYVPIGEMTQFYSNTWDPQAIIYLNNLTEYLKPKITETGSPYHFAKHWHHWYYDFSRDKRVIERIKNFCAQKLKTHKQLTYQSFAAFLYDTTGDTTILKACLEDAHKNTLNIYHNPDDKYHKFNLAHSNPGAKFLGRLPYYLYALDKAGIKFESSTDLSAVPVRGGRFDIADKWPVPTRGWSNAGSTILALSERDEKIKLSIMGVRQYGDVNVIYLPFYNYPELNITKKPGYDLKKMWQEVRKDVIEFTGKPRYNEKGGVRRYTDRNDNYPHYEYMKHDSAKKLYRLEIGTGAFHLPVFLYEKDNKPLTQVLVVARTIFSGGTNKEIASIMKGKMNAYFRTLDDKAVIKLTIESKKRRYAYPTKYKITDSKGNVIEDSSVFMAGTRKSTEITLDPAKNPLPWHIMMISSGDNKIMFTGADELFFAREKEEFDKILPKLKVY
ncbi:MAG: exo-rhamnogalacturonan lyase family protein [Planctomycetota bacterium]|jgi:hypothetical protein